MGSLANAQRSRSADAVTARCNNGKIRAYSGTPPANANTALSGQTLLAELSFGATAFGAASSGVATANAITPDSSADVTGSPSFIRVFESDGSTVVFDMLAACAWQASTAYAVGDRVVNGSNQYRCTTGGASASSGGPTGTGGSISDGTVTWAWEGAKEAEVTPPAGAKQIVQFGQVSMSSLTYTQGG